MCHAEPKQSHELLSKTLTVWLCFSSLLGRLYSSRKRANFMATSSTLSMTWSSSLLGSAQEAAAAAACPALAARWGMCTLSRCRVSFSASVLPAHTGQKAVEAAAAEEEESSSGFRVGSVEVADEEEGGKWSE